MTQDQFVEKKILEELMPEFDKFMTRKMMVNSIYMRDDMEMFAPSPGDFDIQIRSIKDQSCFRIRFTLPVLLLFHISTNYLREVHGYYRNQNFTFPIGFLPAYNCNMNHLTLLRSYEKTFQWFTTSRSNQDEDYFCKIFSNEKGEKMEQSSLNFLLQNNSIAGVVSRDDSDLIKKCFEFLYWRPPLEDFRYRYSTIHNFVYHSTSRIFSTHRIYKTLIKIQDIGNKRYPFGNPKKFDYVEAKVLIMCQNEKDMFFKSANLWIAEPDASRLKPDDIVNCVLDKPVLPRASNVPLTIHGIVGPVIESVELTSPISCIIWKNLHKIDQDMKICELGTLDQIKDQVLNFVKQNPKVFGEEWQKNFNVKYLESLKKFHPIVLESEGLVYHIPPPLLSFILARKINILGSKNDLITFLKFVDLINPRNRSKIKSILRRSSLGEAVQTGSCGESWGLLLKELPRVVNRIVYSRVFSKASSTAL